MLEWVLEESIPRRCSDEAIVQMILVVNFAAIHTSSNVCRSEYTLEVLLVCRANRLLVITEHNACSLPHLAKTCGAFPSNSFDAGALLDALPAVTWV